MTESSTLNSALVCDKPGQHLRTFAPKAIKMAAEMKKNNDHYLQRNHNSC